MATSEKSVHVAFVVRGKSVVTWATNWYAVHAEVAAVDKAVRMGVRAGFELVVVRYMRRGANEGECVLGESRPCAGCSKYLRDRSNLVKNVYWSTREGGFEKERANRINL